MVEKLYYKQKIGNFDNCLFDMILFKNCGVVENCRLIILIGFVCMLMKRKENLICIQVQKMYGYLKIRLELDLIVVMG